MSVELSSVPDSRGHFGAYGGVFVPETLVSALDQLTAEYEKAKKDPQFRRDFEFYLREYVGRPSRLYYARRLSEQIGGAKIYLKREDVNHTGPHPFPMMVRDFQRVIGDEARAQCLETEGKLPDYVVACVGGGSNAAGIFYPFIEDKSVKLMGVEAGGRGSALGEHAATLCAGR